jgi:hypothetical protein
MQDNLREARAKIVALEDVSQAREFMITATGQFVRDSDVSVSFMDNPGFRS